MKINSYIIEVNSRSKSEVVMQLWGILILLILFGNSKIIMVNEC